MQEEEGRERERLVRREKNTGRRSGKQEKEKKGKENFFNLSAVSENLPAYQDRRQTTHKKAETEEAFVHI